MAGAPRAGVFGCTGPRSAVLCGPAHTPVLRYLAERGFPEPFVRQYRIGYAPVASSSRDLLVRQIRAVTGANRTQLLPEAIEAGLMVQDKAGAVRDFFASETSGYILFPNVVASPLKRWRCTRVMNYF